MMYNELMKFNFFVRYSIMKNCPNCGNPCDDGAAFCNKCGAPFGAPNYQAQPMFDPADHTAEFDPADISENKVIAMAPYLMGWVGIIVALLAINNSFSLMGSYFVSIIRFFSFIFNAVIVYFSPFIIGTIIEKERRSL